MDELHALIARNRGFAWKLAEYIRAAGAHLTRSGMQMRLGIQCGHCTDGPGCADCGRALSRRATLNFQHNRAFDRIVRSARRATTLLMRSHDRQAIQVAMRFGRSSWLEGRLALQGAPEAR